MTIATTTNRVDAPGNGSATSFSFAPVVIFQASDLQVTIRDSSGVETALTQGAGSTNYSVTVLSYPGTGAVTYPASGGTPLPSGSTLVIKRIVPILQNVSLTNQGAYLPNIQEGEFDYLTAIDQQQQEQINRTVQVAATDPAIPILLPTSAARAGQFLGFDGSGNPIAAQPAGAGVPISTVMKPVVAANTILSASNLILANGFSLAINGAQAGDIFVGSGLHADMWGSVHYQAVNSTGPEITAQFAMNSNVGLAARADAYKIGLAFSCLGGTNSGDLYGANSNMQGYGGINLITGYESDVNNIGTDQHLVGGSAAVYGIAAVAAGTADSTAGLWVISTSGGGWWDGVAVSAAKSSAYFDGAVCPIGISIHGQHTTGIDMLAGFPITIAMAIPNNSGIRGLDTASTLRNIAVIDTANHLEIGDPANVIVANQAILPSTDNTWQLGASGFRWSTIWGVNGAIQTSHAPLKTAIEKLPPMLELVRGLDPKSWKWKSGGQVLVDAEEEQDVALTEMRPVKTHKIEVVNGVAQQVEVTEMREFPLYDVYPVVDGDGKPVFEHQTPTQREAIRTGKAQPVQKMHLVPRRGKKVVTVKQAVDVPGKRTHAGFLAQDVKAAFDAHGVDYAAHVIGDDGVHGLRPDQLIPLLWKAVQELAAKVAVLEGKPV